jgi:ATP-binding cassette subfamily B protein
MLILHSDIMIDYKVTTMTESAEFSLPQQYPTDRRSPARWVISHALRQWPIMLIALIGALGNAGLLSVVFSLLYRSVCLPRV